MQNRLSSYIIILIKTVFETLLTLFNIVSKGFKKDILIAEQVKSNNGEICVLGNGPSLRLDLEKNARFISSTHCICVNNFALTEHFESVKPRYYYVLDPAFWISDVNTEMNSLRKNIFKAIAEKCSWQMTLICPIEAIHSVFFAELQFPPNIKLINFNKFPLRGAKLIVFYLLNKGYGCIPSYNVLAGALIAAIRLGYKKIFLFGADHSWHQTISVDSENTVCEGETHFYDVNAPKPRPFIVSFASTKTFKMHEIFKRWADVFYWYHIIRSYAKSRDSIIYNASSISFIDAFERIEYTKNTFTES